MTSWLREIWWRCRSAVTRAREDREFDEELTTHLELLIDEGRHRGLPDGQARREAIQRLGRPEPLRQAHREQRGIPVLDMLVLDVRYGCRMLWKAPAFAAIVTLSLALGIGANTALFSLADGLLLRKLPVHEPDRLVYVQRTATATGKRLGMNRDAIEALKNLRGAFSDVAGYLPLIQAVIAIDGAAEPDRLVVSASDNFFSLLGVRPALGQLTSARGQPEIIISHRFWQTRFRGDVQVLDRHVTVNDRAFPIAGVAPEGFLGMSPDSSVDLWLVSPPEDFIPPSALARLQPGVALKAAQTAAAAILQHMDEASAADATGPLVTDVLPAGRGSSSLRDQYERPLLALTALVVLVLFITCANIGHLLLIRNTKRSHEFVVRASLGAARSRLINQLLVESALIGVLGGVSAWLLARIGVSILLSTLPLSAIPEQLQFRTDPRQVAFVAALSGFAVVLFTLAPAWRAARVDVASALKAGSATTTRRGSRRIGLWLVCGQVALSVVVLAGAGLFLRTLHNIASTDLGYDPRNLLQAELNRAIRLRPEEANHINQQLLESISRIPGVQSVTLSNPLLPLWAIGATQPAGYSAGIAGPRFFETLRIPLVRGRLFTVADETRPEQVSIVSESFARQMFPGEDVIGKRAGYNNLEVVGIVKDVKLDNIRWDEPVVYRLAHRAGRVLTGVLVRTTGDPSGVVGALRQTIMTLDSRLLLSITTMDDVIDRSIARERMVALTSACFGALGLVLAAIGLFGVAAFAVVQRTSELGLRIALGASRSVVVREALAETARMFGVGLAVGAAAAWAGTRLLGAQVSGLLYGLDATDWINIGFASLAMVVVALVACLIPALRATRIDPLAAIRYE
jgi:predicted permease